MPDDVIICPACGKKIPLSKALADQVDEQVQARLETTLKKREKEWQEQLAAERRLASAKARKELKTEMAGLSEELAAKEAQLEKAHKNEVALLREKHELQEKQKSFDLEVARAVDQKLKGVAQAAVDRLTEEHRLKDRERDEREAALKRTVDDLNRKLEQRSQQSQGEAGEIELESILRAAFRCDSIEPVAKGVRGADVVQTVRTPNGTSCGSILWECKNAKNWSDTWLVKLRDDQRQQKAELGVIVSVALPDPIHRFGFLDDVWVSDFGSALGLATALRMQLVRLQAAAAAAEGKSSKMELLYGYLSGTEFRQRVEAIVESFNSMSEDLNRERSAMEKSWAKRERQISRVIQSVAGMYGDVQGIIGAALPDIVQLQLPAGASGQPLSAEESEGS